METARDLLTKLPYFKDATQLPAPIPDIEKIRASKSIVSGNSDTATRRVVEIDRQFVVKYGRVQTIEAQNLLFLENNLPEIPAPKLYAFWQEPGPFNEYDDGPYMVLVMELLEGHSLAEIWHTLSTSDQSEILTQLKAAFNLLRNTPCNGKFCSTAGGPLPHSMFYSGPHDPEISGPFDTGDQLVKGLVKRSRINAQENGLFSCLPDFFESNFVTPLSRFSPVLTHGDVQLKNIVARKISADRAEPRWTIGLVDWEESGWYPAYWEYFAAFLAFRWNESDWPLVVERFLQPYGPEAAMLKMIHQDLFW